MTNEANHSLSLEDLQSQTERDLCNALLHSEDVILRWNSNDSGDAFAVEVPEDPKSKIAYPWKPSEPAAETFFNHLEQDFSWEGWEDSEIDRRSQAFYNCLDQLWAVTPLQTALAKKFVTVPKTLLNEIARQAQQLANTSASLVDQLLQCVNDVLPQWAPEDLQVLARPLAYSMRGDDTTAVDTALNSIRPLEWSKLSEIEQARLSLAIARYAIGKINDQR